MKVQPAELIDKMSIVKLKIERVGEPHLKEEYKECENALDEFRKKGLEIEQEWFDKLYEINGKIWDLDFKIRDFVDKEIENISRKELIRIGKDALKIMELMKERVDVKNIITEKTNAGFKEIKIDHVSS